MYNVLIGTIYLYIAHKVCSQEIITNITASNNATYPFTNSSSSDPNSTVTLADAPDDYSDLDRPEVILDTSSGVEVVHDSNTKTKFDNRPLVVHFLQKFSPANWIRPVYEKLNRIKEFLTYPNHPNYGGVLSSSLQQIWEKWHEKGHHFLTGINAAIYGLAPLENYDYPFAYRKISPTTKSRS